MPNRTITFRWNAVSGCTFNGYTLRVKNTSNMDSGGTTYLDTGVGSTEYTCTFDGSGPCGNAPENTDLYWGVRAANAPNGANWAVRRFRIEPESAHGNWEARYDQGSTLWWDPNASITPRCTETINGPELHKDWGSGAPCSGMNGDDWVGDFRATLNFPAGEYVFYLDHDDGVKLWLNGQNIADLGGSGNNDRVCNGQTGYPLNGNADLRVLLREEGGEAKVHLTWNTDTHACIPPLPHADFDASPLSGDAPLNVSFHNTSSGDYTSCHWEYGDGSTGTSCSSNHDHTYTTPGKYTVRLTVTGPGGSDTRTRSDYIDVTASANWRVEYFSDNHLGSRCYDTYQDSTYVFGDWGGDAPASECPSDNFSVRFSKSVYFPGGDYTFALGYDDGARIKIDGQTVVDGWAPSAQHYESRNLSSGYHNVEVEYYENAGDAYLTAFWWGPGFELPRESQDNFQWYAQYWGNKALWWDPVVRVNEGQGFLDHQWGEGGPGYNLPENHFSSRFERTVHFDCGRWRFNIFSDDGVRFWIDGNLVLDEWHDQATSYTPEVDLTEGNHQLRLEHYERTGAAAIQASWEQVSGCPPSPPDLVSPDDDATLPHDADITLDWNASSGATEYYAHLWGPGVDINSGWIGSTDWHIGQLQPGTYYWQVRARNQYGESDWSSTWSFTIQTAPVGPLVYDSHTVDDDNSDQSSGNGDGVVECEETIELYVTLRNQGDGAATGVNATISTSDPYVTWLYNTDSNYPDIPGGGTGTNSNDFDFAVDPNTPNGHVIQFHLDISASNGGPWSDSFSVPVTCLQPDLVPSQWGGWQYPIVPSSITGTSVVNTLYAGQPTYIDWGISNSGNADTGGSTFGDLYIDSNRVAHYDFGNVQAGWTWAFFDWVEVIDTPGWHTLRFIADADDLINESNETNNSWEHQFYWIPSAPYSDNMESGTNNWTATGLWHQVDANSPYPESHSGSHSWWYGQDATGDYDTGSANSGGLTSPSIYIPSSGYYLRFWYRYETETQTQNWDQRWVQISVDGGPFDNVLQLSDDPMNWWLQSPAIDLSGYAGHAIQVRFYFDSLDSVYNDYRGWYIDDFDISTTPPPSCADSHEPNDTLDEATPIAYGQTLTADICPGGDYDFYQFTGSEGDKIVVDIDAKVNGSSLDTYVFLLDSYGNVLAEHDDEIPVEIQDSHLGYQLPHDGTYYIKVRAWNHPSVGGTDYFYNIHLLTDDTSPTAEITSPDHYDWLDPNLQTITTNVSDGESGIRNVTFYWHDANWDGSSDWIVLEDDHDPRDGWMYDFNTSGIPEQPQGCVVFIYAYDWAGNYTGYGSYSLGIDRTPPTVTASVQQMYGDAPFRDFYVYWWDGYDNLSGIASYDVQYRDGAGGSWTNLLTGTTDTYYRFVGQDGHTYYFRARARDKAGNLSNYAGGNGDAQHTVQICSISPDGYEADNAYTSAKWIYADESQVHNIHTEGDQDWIKFQATAGFTYTLSTTNDGGHADTVLYLYDTDGVTLITSNDDYPGMWPSSQIDWQAPADGVYYVKVEHWDPYAYGCTTAYGLSVSGEGLPQEPQHDVYLPIVLKRYGGSQ
ncbi:MAG: pre-peptidase C-terminal domain-containing protein [Anaerolineae bacterium]|nr:pre-peptidase C-terminal domain-containing protein [Anaerolineae bacterium]